MATRFRRSIKIAPGVKLNINKKSIGITAGVKGAHVSVNSKGRKTTTVGIPGTGLSYTETSKIGASTDKKTYNHNSQVSSNADGTPPNPPKNRIPKKPNKGKRTGKTILFSVLIGVLGIAAFGGLLVVFTEGVELLDIAMLTMIAGFMGLSIIGLKNSRKDNPVTSEGSPNAPKKKSLGFIISIVLIIIGIVLAFAAPSELDIESISLQIPEQEMDINDEQDITFSITPDEASASDLSFETSNDAVITFSGESGSGKISSHKEGEAYIYIAADNGVKSQKIKITVVDKEKIKKAKEEAAKKKAEEERLRKLEEKRKKEAQEKQQQEEQQTYVYIPQTGSKYHNNPSCSNMNNPSHVTIDEALNMGFQPCKRCY